MRQPRYEEAPSPVIAHGFYVHGNDERSSERTGNRCGEVPDLW